MVFGGLKAPLFCYQYDSHFSINRFMWLFYIYLVLALYHCSQLLFFVINYPFLTSIYIPYINHLSILETFYTRYILWYFKPLPYSKESLYIPSLLSIYIPCLSYIVNRLQQFSIYSFYSGLKDYIYVVLAPLFLSSIQVL